MKNSESREENSNEIIRFLKIVLSVIFGSVAGPLELLCVGFIIKDKSPQIFWLIGGIFVFSIVYLIVLFILNNLFHRKDYDGDKCWLIMRILAPISILVTWFVIGKFVNGGGTVSSIFLTLLFMVPNLPIFVPAIGGNSNGSSKKIRATTWDYGRYRETTYKDEDGNKVGTATSFDWGPVTDTTIKDKDGNKTKIEHWKF